MALSFGQTGTADSITGEYLSHEWVHIHLDAVDGIARDTIEGFKALPRRGAEVGGLLLGHVEPGERPVVWIDKYQRIECGHRYGPQFILDDEEHRALEHAAAAVSQTSELNVVGFYRSHTRPGFQLEQPDLELINQYFSDPTDLILLIRPENMLDISAQFFTRGTDGEIQEGGPVFPFRGRIVGLEEPEEPDTARFSPQEKGRRIVPDFAVTEAPKPHIEPVSQQTDPSEEDTSARFRKWWPFGAALLLVGAAAAFLLMQRGSQPENSAAPAAVQTLAPIRPLGLYVDPSGQNWRVSWNPSATALNSARAVQLFVRDGDDQARIDLSQKDLQSGTYQYQPKGLDVTFRLEVTEAAGHISAESFRFMKSAPPPVAVEPRPVAQTYPKPVHKVAPVVPASIRPRIHGTISIDVRVSVDERGRVISATPVGKPSAGLDRYLADRAVVAAKQWRFVEGTPGSETIHFVFEK